MSKITLQTKCTTALEDACLDFLLSRQAINCSPRTLKWYQYTTGKFVGWLKEQGVTDPAEMSARFVRAYLAELAPGLSDTTLHGHARAVKTLLRFWHSEGYSQAVKFEMPKLLEKRLPVLDAEQLKRVIEACITPRDKALVLFMVDTGTRRAETIALNWKDLDMSNGLVRVDQGKGGKARSVVVGAKTRRALLKYRRTLADREGPLFQTRNGQRLKPDGLRSILFRIGERAGIHFTPHQLRRTFATLARRAGMDLVMLQALLGHSTLDMTRQYVRWVEDDLLEAHHKASPVDNL